MGRAQVRTAIQTYLQAAGIPYLGTVWPARPEIVDEADYTHTMTGQAVGLSANGSACVAVVNIVSDRRQRRADVGRGAVTDTNIHDVAVELFFACPAGDAVGAQGDYDTLVDALIVAIRANPTPGGGSVVWSAGEYTAGVDHTQTSPYTSDDGMTILISGVVRFEAWEWLAGTGV